MKDIKFRAWDKERNEWTNAWITGGGTKNNILELAVARKNYELMQFTGLHDKNKKDIYKGDILNPGRRVVYFGIYDTVFEQGNGFYTICQEKPYPKMPFSFSERQADGSEIIGNIYENPEFLK